MYSCSNFVRHVAVLTVFDTLFKLFAIFKTVFVRRLRSINVRADFGTTLKALSSSPKLINLQLGGLDRLTTAALDELGHDFLGRLMYVEIFVFFRTLYI